MLLNCKKKLTKIIDKICGKHIYKFVIYILGHFVKNCICHAVSMHFIYLCCQ